jgi:hypothetical protein
MLAELKREVGSLVVQATACSHRQDSDRGRSAAPGRGNSHAIHGFISSSEPQSTLNVGGALRAATATSRNEGRPLEAASHFRRSSVARNQKYVIALRTLSNGNHQTSQAGKPNICSGCVSSMNLWTRLVPGRS